MNVGLGTGSTAKFFIEELGRRCREEGLRVRGVPTSVASTAQAHALRLVVIDLPVSGVDLAVDGADQVDPELRLVKGGGGALVRERIVAAAASRFVVVVDRRKLVSQISAVVPLEILPFGGERTLRTAGELMGGGASWRLGADGQTERSDNGNLLADAPLTGGENLEELAARLGDVPGVVGHGLFLGMADLVLVGADDGEVTELLPTDSPGRGRQ